MSTQTWLQVTRLAMRFASYGCSIAVICPEESHLTYAPGVARRFRFHLPSPLRALRHAIAASRPDYLLPTDDLSVWFLHELSHSTPELRALIERSLGKSNFYPVLRSRFRLLSLAHQLGISVPRTELIADVAELDHWCAPGSPGFVLKKDGTWGGLGVQMVQTATEAHDAFFLLARGTAMSERMARWLRNGDQSAFARLHCLSRPEITAQSFVHGVPANSMYACHEGRILGEVQARVVASKGKTGPSLVIQLMNDPRITRAGALLASALGLSGFFGLDFMLDAKTGEPFLIEMNPRSTQLGHIAVAEQTDLAGLLWARWTGEPAPPAGDGSLGSAICFYPEGEQWTERTASFPGCRSDVLPAERELLALLAGGNPAPHTLRRRLWSSLARLKESLQNDPAPQAFYYQDLSKRSDEVDQPAEGFARRATVISIAS